MKRFAAVEPDELSHVFSQSLMWAAIAGNDIAVAASIDDGRFTENVFAKCMSEIEIQKAARIIDPEERRHFMYRRSFQRAFLRDVVKWPGNLSQISLVHQQDSPPSCLDFPKLNLSFSSSGTVFLAVASESCEVGVDLEKMRLVENAAALAARFFTLPEALAVRSAQPADRDSVFLRIWTAKEAGLKAVGKGIESGLHNIAVSIGKNGYTIDIIDENIDQQNWHLEYLNLLPEHIVAVVHRVAK